MDRKKTGEGKSQKKKKKGSRLLRGSVQSDGATERSSGDETCQVPGGERSSPVGEDKKRDIVGTEGGALGKASNMEMSGGDKLDQVQLAEPVECETGAEQHEVLCGLLDMHALCESDMERQRKVWAERNFMYKEYVSGELVNVVEGLELHRNFLQPAEQQRIVAYVERWLIEGKEGKLIGSTYVAPKRFMRGKGRKTIQFGCCYNYAPMNGQKKGIIVDNPVEDMPPIFVALCDRLVRWGILTPSQKPNSGIVNVYEVDDCIPPHIDDHDFLRPFVTISLLSTTAMKFGTRLKPIGPGEFEGHFSLMLPPGSCLVFKGNAADVVRHCIPSVKEQRISITLRRMRDCFRDAIGRMK